MPLYIDDQEIQAEEAIMEFGEPTIIIEQPQEIQVPRARRGRPVGVAKRGRPLRERRKPKRLIEES